jgi:hypothetical protein
MYGRSQPRSQDFHMRTRRDARKPWSGPVTWLPKKWQHLTATRQGVARYSLMKYTSLRNKSVNSQKTSQSILFMCRAKFGTNQLKSTVAHNGNTQFIFNIQFMLLILLSEFFWPNSFFSNRNFFSNRLFFCEIFSSCNFLLLFTVGFFNRNLFSTEIYFRQKFFQPKFIFRRNLFSAEIYFQQKFVFNRNLFSAEIYFQPKFIFNRNLFSAEIYFQQKFLWFHMSYRWPLLIMLQRK